MNSMYLKIAVLKFITLNIHLGKNKKMNSSLVAISILVKSNISRQCLIIFFNRCIKSIITKLFKIC